MAASRSRTNTKWLRTISPSNSDQRWLRWLLTASPSGPGGPCVPSTPGGPIGPWGPDIGWTTDPSPSLTTWAAGPGGPGGPGEPGEPRSPLFPGYPNPEAPWGEMSRYWSVINYLQYFIHQTIGLYGTDLLISLIWSARTYLTVLADSIATCNS